MQLQKRFLLRILVQWQPFALAFTPALPLIGSGCAPLPGDNGGGDLEPSPLDPIPLTFTGTPAFGVALSADRTSGSPGTVFTVTAHVSAGISVSNIQWLVAGTIDASNIASSAAFTFATPGDQIVTAMVTDDRGRQVSDGILLKVFDPAVAPTDRTTAITPSAGMPGTIVHIESNVLNDAGAQIQVRVGNADPFEPFRPELGAATFIVPLTAADGFTQATDVTIHVLADGVDAAQFGFTLSPLPALSGPPGHLTRQWFENASMLFDDAGSKLDDMLSGLNYTLSAAQNALLKSLLRLAESRFDQVRALLLPQLDQLDPTSLAVLDQVLVANGLADPIPPSASTTSKSIRSNKNAQDRILDLIIQFHDVTAALRTLVNSANSGAALLTTLSAASGTSIALTGALLGTAGLMAELGLAADLISQLDALLPHVLPELEVGINPNRLKDQEKAVIQIVAHLDRDPAICNGSNTRLIDDFSRQSALRLLNSFGLARLAVLAGISDPVLGAATAQAIYNYLRDSINQLANAAVQVGDIDGTLDSIKGVLCNLENRRDLHLQPEPGIVTLHPSSGGNLLNLQDDTIDFYCQRNPGKISISVRREAGLSNATGPSHVLIGETSVTCVQGDCTENALSSLTFRAVRRQNLVDDSPCTIVKPTLETRTMDVFFKNNDPQRRVAVAAVVLYDLQRGGVKVPQPAPCSDPNSFYSTMDECLDRETQGCGTAAGLFLEPSIEGVIPITYNCKHERLNQSGACGDAELETLVGHVYVQAVFCEDFDDAQENFCSEVHPSMLINGEPWSQLPAVDLTDCP